MPTPTANRKPKPLALDIYSALLGGRPHIEASAPPLAQAPEPKKAASWYARNAERLLDEARTRLIDLVSVSTVGRHDRRPDRRHPSGEGRSAA